MEYNVSELEEVNMSDIEMPSQALITELECLKKDIVYYEKQSNLPDKLKTQLKLKGERCQVPPKYTDDPFVKLIVGETFYYKKHYPLIFKKGDMLIYILGRRPDIIDAFIKASKEGTKGGMMEAYFSKT